MRVLYLTDNNSVHNRRFLEKLLSAGHEMWSWNLTYRAPADDLPPGVQQIHSTSPVERGSPPRKFEELLPQLRSVLQTVQPALVHAGPIQSAGYLAALAGIHPLLLMSWGSDLLIDTEPDSGWRQATEFALRKADAFFCDCDTVRRKANSFHLFADSEIVQFPWGIKSGVFSPLGPLPPGDIFSRTPGTTTFIYTRSYAPLYGTDVLLDGFNRARNTNPSLRLLLVGEGSESQAVRRYIQDRRLNAHVSPIGPRPTDELPMWFRAADAYISCAKSDGTSISLLEAMATGLPVLVTDIPSNREWVAEPENGFLAPPGSAEAVTDRILRIAQLTAEERANISARNLRIVAARADWDRNFPRLLDMYEGLVAQTAGSVKSNRAE